MVNSATDVFSLFVFLEYRYSLAFWHSLSPVESVAPAVAAFLMWGRVFMLSMRRRVSAGPSTAP